LHNFFNLCTSVLALMISSWQVLQVWLLGWLYMVTLLLGSFTGGLESYFCCKGLESCFFLSGGLA
jgi:hypothetical protein